MNIGVIGYGYWGPNLVRNFSEVPDATVTVVSDSRPQRLDIVRRRFPQIELTTDARSLIHHPNVDAVAIATPVSTHFALASEALRAGKHVLLEKPMTASSEEALTLIEEAEARRLVLMVDHTFVYTGAVRHIRKLIDQGALGTIYYYDSTRINLGLFQHDVNVIWDLAVHDLYIMDYLLPQAPVEVSVTGVGHVDGARANCAYLTAFYDLPIIAHVNVNWLSPVKIRRTLIGGSKKMIVYDDTEASEKVKLYDKGVNVMNGEESEHKLRVSYRSGDMHAPQLDTEEALGVIARHFTDCVRTGAKPLTGGEAGLRVVSVLEAATRSLQNRGTSERLTRWGALPAVSSACFTSA